jgi:hypothetical protein
LRTRACRVLLMSALALASVGTFWSPPTRAQGAATGQRLHAIRERMEVGQGLVVQGDWTGAAAAFDAGYERYPYSAFLFNAGVCYQKLGRKDTALERFKRYVEVDPHAPDVSMVRARITQLESELAAASNTPSTTEPVPPPAPLEKATAAEERAMKSLVLVETEPAGAPLELWAPVTEGAPSFVLGKPNPGWERLLTTTAPASLTLDVGRYHVVIEKFRDYNPTSRDIEVTPGKVLHFMANLSQGEFLGFLRVSANVRGAKIYLNDPEKKKPEWGLVPHSELVKPGSHRVLVEAPGYQPLLRTIQVGQGEQKELSVDLTRLGWGSLRIDSNAENMRVRVDGRLMGTWNQGEPPLELSLEAGAKTITVTSRHRKTFQGTVDVPKGQILPLHVTLVHTFPRGPAWIQAIAAGALVGAGTYLGLASNGIEDDLEKDRRRGVLDPADDRIGRGKLYAVGADVGFVAGGLLGLLATYNFVRDPLPESSVETGDLVEFGTPNKARRSRPAPEPQPKRKAAVDPQPGPALFSGATGPGMSFGLGGRF